MLSVWLAWCLPCGRVVASYRPQSADEETAARLFCEQNARAHRAATEHDLVMVGYCIAGEVT